MSNPDAVVRILRGGIRVDERSGEVYRNGSKIALPEQLFRLLMLLGEHHGEVVTREQIRQNLWSDTYVNFDDSINSAVRRLRHSLEDPANGPQLIETLPGHGYRLLLPAPSPCAMSVTPEASAHPTKPRLAALPFDNLSGNPDEEYLADSLTEAVITALAKISALYVKPRCLVMGYKQPRRGLAGIGKSLRVDAVLQGSLVRFEGHLRVSAQLLSVAGEEHLWAENYNCYSGDILTFQMEVAESIAAQVADKLVPSRNRRSPYISPVSGAHDAHLKAHLSFRSFTNDGFWKARQYWKKAVHEDPSYPQAYAGLAESYNMLGMTGLLNTADALDEARGAATQAVRIDESVAEAHSALAHTYAAEWNWAAAGLEFSRAVHLDPHLTTGNPCHYVEYLMAVMGPAAAIKEIEKIQATRPLSSFLGIMLGWVHYGNRNYDRAIQAHQEVLKNDPRHPLVYLMLALDHSQKKRHRIAIEKCRRVLSIGKTRLALNALGYIYAASGNKSGAKEIITQLRRLLRTSFASPYALATIYSGLGESEAAFDFLEQACERHDPELLWLRWDPQLDNLRCDPRMQSLLKRMGLQPVTQEVASSSLVGPAIFTEQNQ
jgi:TolB-like protein/tetratricopeptide (TPR) repeat protein